MDDEDKFLFRFQNVFGEVLGHSDTLLHRDWTLFDLGADEHDARRITVYLEAEFEIHLPLDHAPNVITKDTTVATCLQLVRLRLFQPDDRDQSSFESF